MADPVSGKKNTDVARYRLSDRQRVPMSLSGKERNHLFINLEGESFKDISNVSGADSIQDGRSFAILDYDRDGWQDMVLTNSNGPVVQLFKNQLKNAADRGIGNFIALRFIGGNRSGRSSESFSNRDGVGAKIKIELDGRALTGEFSCGEGLAAQNSSTKIFGLGAATHAKSITIAWPQGKVQQVEGVRSGELVTFYEDQTETKDKTGVSRISYVKNRNEAESSAVQNRRFQGLQFISDNNENKSTKLNMYVSMATWCPSCKRHLPELKQLRSMFDSSVLGMTGVPISARDDAEKLERYVAEQQPAYELTGSWTSNQIFKFFKLALTQTRKEVLPSTIITDANGDVLDIMAGVPSASDIIRLMPD